MFARKKKQSQGNELVAKKPDEDIDLEICERKEHEQAPGAVVDEIKENVRASSKWIWVALLAGFCVSLACLMQFGGMHRRSFATSVRVTPRSPVVAPEECGDTQEQWHRLVQWVSARGGWIHPGLSSGVFEDGVRGLKAAAAIEVNRTLFKMPESLFVNLKTVKTHPQLGPVYDAVPELHDGLGGLAVFLIHEALNRSSAWRPFLCTLPARTRLPMFLSPKMQAKTYEEMIGGPVTPAFSAYLQAFTNETWLRYGRVVPALTGRFPDRFSAADYSMDRWAWAVGVIFSRSWSRPFHDPVIEKRTRRKKVNIHTLVPGMDMPNHNARARLPKFASYKDKTVFILNAHRSYQPGEQVFITYGDKCNDELLATYGFVPANNSHTVCKTAANEPEKAAAIAG